jgi:peptidoglycan/xylan/chitin deacetylase (PgdA/CDA1 family)
MTGGSEPGQAVSTSWRRRIVKVAAEAVDLARSDHPGIVVLIYHRVGRRTSQSVDLPVAQFDDQMAELAASGRVITLDRAVDVLSGSEPAPALRPDPVVITFDDGTADLADLATPVLERHCVPASVYVATDFVDRSLPFPDDGVALSWSALSEMASTGLWQIESHTHTHALLDRLEDGQIAAELDRSIDLIGEHVGRAPSHFAYPKALPPTPSADFAVRSRFRSAALAGTRVNRFGRTDPWRLSRTPIQVDDGPRWFRRKALGGMAFEDDLRRAVNRVRYASSTT